VSHRRGAGRRRRRRRRGSGPWPLRAGASGLGRGRTGAAAGEVLVDAGRAAMRVVVAGRRVISQQGSAGGAADGLTKPLTCEGSCDAVDQPRPDPDGLFPAAAVAAPDPRWHHRTAAGAAGEDRFAGRLGVDQPDDRRAGRRVRGHRRQVASPLVGSAGHGLARRCEEVGSATVFHPGPGRRPQGAGLSATRSQWCPAVAVELPGPGRTGRR